MNRIAIVSTNKSSWGGSEYLWYLSALRLKESGKSVVVSIPRWKEIPDAVSNLRRNNIEVHFNTDYPDYKKLVNRFVPSSFQIDHKDDGYKFLNKFKPDLVIISQGGNTGGIDLMEYCIKHDLKFITVSNAANESKWPSDELNKRLSEVLPKALKNYYVSRANIALTELQIGQRISNTGIIFNPFNVKYTEDINYPEAKENYILGNVARHEFYAKGQDILFQVLNEKKWRERNLIVKLYGKGEHSNSVKKLKNYFDLNKVSIEGHINTTEIWKNCHALILTSRYEGLPLALVEAMLCARFGIVTAVSGNPEIIIDNENGFLAKASIPEFVDEALERAWQRRNEWEKIGIKAKSYIKTIIPEDPIGVFCKEISGLLMKDE